MFEEHFDGHIASEMNLDEAVVRGILLAPNYVTTVYQYQKDLARYQTRVDNLRSPGIQDANQKYLDALRRALEQTDGLVWGDRIFEKCGIGRDERGDGGKTLEIRGKRRLPARDGGANYQQS